MAEKGKLDHIDGRLKDIEGGGDHTFADMEELFLVPNMVIPPKFKTLDFDKYKGTTCPKNHLKMYCRKMGVYAKDDPTFPFLPYQEGLSPTKCIGCGCGQI